MRTIFYLLPLIVAQQLQAADVSVQEISPVMRIFTNAKTDQSCIMQSNHFDDQNRCIEWCVAADNKENAERMSDFITSEQPWKLSPKALEDKLFGRFDSMVRAAEGNTESLPKPLAAMCLWLWPSNKSKLIFCSQLRARYDDVESSNSLKGLDINNNNKEYTLGPIFTALNAQRETNISPEPNDTALDAINKKRYQEAADAYFAQHPAEQAMVIFDVPLQQKETHSSAASKSRCIQQ